MCKAVNLLGFVRLLDLLGTLLALAFRQRTVILSIYGRKPATRIMHDINDLHVYVMQRPVVGDEGSRISPAKSKTVQILLCPDKLHRDSE